MVLAVFDFDGTLLSRDSLSDFLIQTFGWKRFLFRLPWILLLKGATTIGLLSTDWAKEQVFISFFRGMHRNDFNKACLSYAARIESFIYPTALEEIHKHQKAGHPIVIVSASVPDWIRPWATQVGIQQVIGTELEFQEERLTGRFATPNCKGAEKVHRLRSLFPDLSQYTLYVYGDSSGDKEILAVADKPFYKPFKK